MGKIKNTNSQISTAQQTTRPSKRLTNSTLPDQELSPEFFMSVVGQWWKVLIPATLLLLVASIGLTMFLFKPKYRAHAALRIKDAEPFVAFSHKTNRDHREAQKYVFTQIELLRSRPILEMVMAKPEVARMEDLAKKKDPIDWLAKKGLMISPKGDSELLEINFAGTDPESSAMLVNSVINSYFSLRKERANEQTRRIVDLLDAEKTRREKVISVLQTEIRELEKQLVAKDPNMLATSVSGADVIISDNPLKGIQENLASAQVERKIVEAQIIALEESLERLPVLPMALVDQRIDQSPDIMSAMNAINEKRALRAQIVSASVHREEDAAAKRLEREIGRLEDTIETLRAEARPRIEEEMRAYAGLESQGQLEKLRTKLATQDLIVESLRNNYQQRLRDAGLSGGQTMDLRVKKDDLLREKQVFDLIAQRTTELRTEMNAPNRVTPLYMATAPTIPVEYAPWKFLALALVGSLCLPMGIAVLWERSVNRVTNLSQLEGKTHIPVIGEIARLPAKSLRHNGSEYELGVFEESVDSLRTGLILANESDEFQVLSVASAVSGEGKSSIASQLAVSLARSSCKPTLLIDGDMRAPDAHRIFKIPITPGLADVLAGTSTLDEAINTSWSEHVHVLPSGQLDRNPHKLLGTGEFKRLLDEARLWYRYVVIDTPPLLAASESLVMSRDADGTLVCAMRDVSRENHIKMTYEKLESVGAAPIGVVLNGVPTRAYAKRYGSYNYTG